MKGKTQQQQFYQEINLSKGNQLHLLNKEQKLKLRTLNHR